MRVTYNNLTWLVYIIDLPDRNIGAWHDSSTLQIHPRINIGLQYIRNTSEYIPMLHIHQHSLLTRKVFSRRNFQHKSYSLYLLDHHWVLIIFKSSSYSSHIHIQVIFMIGSRSSLDIVIGFGTSLDMDHHWIWIVTRSGSFLLDHHH